MSVRLRLARGGTKKRPYYRLVAATKTRARDGKFLERIGSYNPMLKSDDPKRVVVDIERAKYWLSVGAQPSERVAIFLQQKGVLEPAVKDKKSEQTKQHLPRAKTLARREEQAKAATDAAANAAAKASEAAKVASDAAEAAKTAAVETAAPVQPTTDGGDKPAE